METKIGRPPKDKTGPKRQRMEIRLEESEKAAMEVAASSAGLSLSDWVRSTLLKASKRRVK